MVVRAVTVDEDGRGGGGVGVDHDTSLEEEDDEFIDCDFYEASESDDRDVDDDEFKSDDSDIDDQSLSDKVLSLFREGKDIEGCDHGLGEEKINHDNDSEAVIDVKRRFGLTCTRYTKIKK
ncbi:uncharacterized protein LOC130736908 [Lotus japonicus]|uniref:uncharacterized protein LOC130736908 n=1 Tax=Lotus japonicus TaxID=34305 RepID=UPI002585527C|nr:uncharacterized protein LOC130736908 [Lotus japonicus]